MASLRDLAYAPPVQSSLRQASLQSGATPEQAYADAISLNSPFEAGAKSAIRGSIGGLKAAAAGVQDAFGYNPDDMYAAAAEDAQRAQMLAPQVHSLGDIHDFGDALAYGAGQVGAMAPFLALGGAGGLAGRGLNAAFRGGMTGAEATHAGAMAAFTPTMAGEQMAQMHEIAPEMGPGERLLRGLAVGGAQAVAGAAVPARLLGAPAAGGFVSGMGKQLASGAAGMAAMDVIGQGHRTTYDPTYQFDPAQTGEAAVAGAVGMAPYAVPHAVMGSAGHLSGATYDAAGNLIKAGAKKAGGVVVPDAVKAGYEKVKGAVEGAGDYAAEVKDSMIADDAATNAGIAAAKVSGDISSGVSSIVENTLPSIREAIEGAGDTLSHHMRSNENRLKKTLEELSVFPEEDGSNADALPRALNEREGFFRAMSKFYGDRGDQQKTAQMNRAADAIKTMNEAEALDPKDIQSMWGEVSAAAQRVKIDATGDAKTKPRFGALSKWLDTQPDAKYSGLISPTDRANIRNSQNHLVDDNYISEAMHEAYRQLRQNDSEGAPARGEVMSMVRKFTRAMLGKDPKATLPNQETRKDFADFVKDEFGPQAGRVLGIIAESINRARADEFGETKGADGKTDLYSFIKGNLKDTKSQKADSRVTDVMHLIQESDALAEKLAGRREIKPEDIPEPLFKALQGRIKAREEAGLDEHPDLRAVLQEELSAAVDSELGQHFKGSLGPIKQAVRDMHERLYGGIKRDMSVGDSALARDMMSAEQAGVTREERMDDEKPDWENANGLSVVKDGPSERDVHDQGRPLSGQPTAHDLHEGYHGELGTEKKRHQDLYSPEVGGKPKAGGGGYAEVDHTNVLEHVSRMKREPGMTDDQLLDAMHQEVTAHENTRAADIRDELDASRIDYEDKLALLDREYNRAMRDKKAALAGKEPWEAFDAVKTLEESGVPHHEARLINDLYWAQARVSHKGTGREFFEKFKHSFVTSRNMAGSHERLDYYDMAKGNLTQQAMKSRGIKGVAPEHGVISYENADGSTNYLDLPKLLEHSLGKVRTREEGIDELGNKERYDDGLYGPDGKVNTRYVADMRSALANVMVSLLESKEYKISPETRELLLKTDEKGNWQPPTELLLKRGANGEGDVTLGDVLSTEKPVKFDKKQFKEIVKTADGVPAIGRAANGLLWGTQREPLTSKGKPIVIDTRALIAHTAKVLGVDLKGAPTETHFALLNEGIASLIRSGMVDNLPMPTTAQRKNLSMPAEGKKVGPDPRIHTLNKMYQHLVIGDKPYLKESGEAGVERVSGAEDTLITLDVTGDKGDGKISRLGAANRFTLEPDNRSISGLDGFAKALEREINGRNSAIDPVKFQRIDAIQGERATLLAVLKEAETKGLINREAEAKVRALNAEEAKLTVEARKEGLERIGKTELNEADIARHRAEDTADFEENGKREVRDNLDESNINQLVALLRNVSDRAEEMRGYGEEKPFIPDDGVTGFHDKSNQPRKIYEGTGQGSGGDFRDAAQARKNISVPEHISDAELATRGDMIPGTLAPVAKGGKVAKLERKVDSQGNPTETQAEFDARKTAAATELADTNAQLRAAMIKERAPTDGSAAATTKADPELQNFLTDITKGKQPSLKELGPEGIKTWYDEAAKIGTDAAKSAMRAIENYARIEGVDVATGKFKDEQLTSRSDLEFADGAKSGTAELRVNAAGEVEVVQGGKVIGELPGVDAAKAEGAIANVAKIGQKFVVDVTTAGKTGEMPVYEGNTDVPVARKTLSLKQNARVEQGEATRYEPADHEVNKKLTAGVLENGRAGDVTFKGANGETAYSAKRFEKTFGTDTLNALERALQDKASGKEVAPTDASMISPMRLNAILSGKLEIGTNVGKQVVEQRDAGSAARLQQHEMKAKKIADSIEAEKYSHIVLKDGTRFEGEQATEVVDKVNNMFNGKYAELHDALYDKAGNPVAGATITKDSPHGFAIQLSLGARSMLGSTSMHESLHGLFKILGQNEQGKVSMDKLYKSLTGEIVQERLKGILDKLPLDADVRKSVMEAIKNDREEAAAYAFQFWATGELKLGNESGGFFSKAVKMLRGLIGVTTEYERSEAFLTSFLKGELGRSDFKPSALEKAFAEKRGDQAVKAIKEHAEPFMKVLHTVFDSSRKAMERLNMPEATDLMNKYTGYGEGQGYIKRVTIESRRLASQVQRVMDAHKPEEIRDAIAEIYAGEPKSDAGKAIKAFIESVNEYAGRDKDDLPTIWDYSKIGKNRADFDQAIKDFGVTKEHVKGAAVLDILHDMGYADHGENHTHVEFMPQYQNERAKWIQSDPHQFLRSLIVQSVKRTEHGKLFKPGEVKAQLDLIRAKGGDEAYFKAKDFVDGMEGKLGQNMSPAVRNLMRAALTVGNVVTLPFALFSAAVDPFHLAARSNSTGEAASAYAAGVGSIFKSINSLFGGKHKNTAAEQFAEDIGAIEHSMMTDVLGDVYLGDHAEGWTKKANDWFFKANMLDGWTRQMRVAAVSAGQRFIIDHAAKVAAGEGKHSARFMEELGLKPSDVKVEDGNLVVNDKIKMALNKFVDESIVRPDQATNAIWMNDPRFMLLSHMKRFTYAFTENVLNRSMKEMSHGNMVPLSMMMASMPAILLADMGKHFIKGDYDTWMNGKSGGQWFEYGMSRAGMNGKLQFGLDAVHDAEMGGTPFDSAMGPDLGLVRKMAGQTHHAMPGGDGLGLIGLADGGFHTYQGVQAIKGMKAANDADAQVKANAK